MEPAHPQILATPTNKLLVAIPAKLTINRYGHQGTMKTGYFKQVKTLSILISVFIHWSPHGSQIIYSSDDATEE